MVDIKRRNNLTKENFAKKKRIYNIIILCKQFYMSAIIIIFIIIVIIITLHTYCSTTTTASSVNIHILFIFFYLM